ncbi:MAG: hypothetical protein ABSC29_01575 [Minisyncoccia bacterium]|jgi:hypothetical protein
MDETNNKIRVSVSARQKEERDKVLQELRKLPIVSVACDRASISRWTYYRWKTQDKEFAAAADEAMRDGEQFVSDLSEAQVIGLIKDRNLAAITLWLRSHHEKYSNKLELTGQVKVAPEELTPEQQAAVDRALRLASLAGGEAAPDGSPDKQNNQINHDKQPTGQ